MSLARLYADTWANFWTPSAWALAAVTTSHLLHRRHIKRIAGPGWRRPGGDMPGPGDPPPAG